MENDEVTLKDVLLILQEQQSSLNEINSGFKGNMSELISRIEKLTEQTIESNELLDKIHSRLLEQ